MALTEHIIKQVKEANDITQVVDSVVPLKKGQACCPFHKDKTPSFNVNHKEQFFKCFGCGKSGDVIEFVKEYHKLDFYDAVKFLADRAQIVIEEPKVYVRPKPSPAPKHPTAQEAMEGYFAKRGISKATLKAAGVTVGNEWMPQTGKETDVICFNYYRQGELINVKYRDKNKNFKLAKDAELILYNLDSIEGATSVYLVEGEVDCLSLVESGCKAVVSVPNGASGNQSYLDNCAELFKGKKIHIATDNDIPGRQLRDSLAARFGKSRCDYISWEECKDANEYLLKYGKDGLKEKLQDFTPFPLENSFTLSEIQDGILDMYENGLPEPCRIGMGELDNLVGWLPGYITLITGIPSHGKSTLLDEIAIRLFAKFGWKFAWYSKETKPFELHFSKWARKLTGKYWSGPKRMSRSEVVASIDALNDNFYFLKSKGSLTVTELLEAVDELVQNYGVKAFVIDAWNTLNRTDIKDDNDIGMRLQEIANFCEERKVHAFIVAHPFKMKKQKDSNKYEVVGPYEVKGSSEWYDKSDIILSVYRDFEAKNTTVHVQKVKNDNWGNVGAATFDYHPESSRYITPLLPIEQQAASWIRLPEQATMTFDEPKAANYNPDKFIEPERKPLPVNDNFLPGEGNDEPTEEDLTPPF